MYARLVVGCGRMGATLLDALAERPGRTVVLADDRRAEQLRDRDPSVEVIAGDPSNPLDLTDDEVASVFVAGDDPSDNLAAARAAREAYPEAFLLAYAGLDAPAETTARLRETADRVVDPGDALGSYLADRVTVGEGSMHELRSILSDIDGELAIVTHDNPDPDAIASAIALENVAERLGQSARGCYYGSINHQENRALINLLDFGLEHLDAETDLSQFGGFALVDHARPGVNDGLPRDTSIDVVIDHHPPRGPVNARFTDLRSDVGATSTLLVDYYRRLGADIDEDVATGLLFGIRVDTDEFRREVSVADFEASAHLIRHADLGALQRIEDPSVSSDTLETVAEAIVSRKQHGSVLLSGVGSINDRDTLAQAADRLLTLEDVSTTLVHGITDGMVYISARSRGTDLDLGEALREAFGQIGSAGGHADMAGAQIELGVMEAIDDDEQPLRDVVDTVVTDRFLDVLDLHPSQVSFGAYGTDVEQSLAPPPGTEWSAPEYVTSVAEDRHETKRDAKHEIESGDEHETRSDSEREKWRDDEHDRKGEKQEKRPGDEDEKRRHDGRGSS